MEEVEPDGNARYARDIVLLTPAQSERPNMLKMLSLAIPCATSD